MKLREQIDHELREMHPDEKILQDILKDPEKRSCPGSVFFCAPRFSDVCWCSRSLRICSA